MFNPNLFINKDVFVHTLVHWTLDCKAGRPRGAEVDLEDLRAADVLKKTLAAGWEMEDSWDQDHCKLLPSLTMDKPPLRGADSGFGDKHCCLQRSVVLVAIVFYLVCVDVHVP